MGTFRFAVMGAGNIANRFSDAVDLIEGCEICAVASKSAERAADFAARHKIAKSYADYAAMLEAERPDAVYVAVTTDAHHALTMLCLEHGVPVLCEKAMFRSFAEADSALTLSEERGVFAMEAMWSRFLPPILRAKTWLAEGKIGTPVFAEAGIGFRAAPDPKNRYFNPDLGGGAAYDLTVYPYEILTWVMGRPVEAVQLESVSAKAWAGTPVDAVNLILLRFAGRVPAVLKSSLLTSPDETLSVYGTEGKIVVPHHHVTSEAMLYRGGRLVEHYLDTETKNGFMYEIEEVMRCVRAGEVESPVVPHALTREFAALCDRINAEMRDADPSASV